MALKSCVTVYLDDDVLKWVKEVADLNCMSISSVIRDAVRNYRLALDDDDNLLFEVGE